VTRKMRISYADLGRLGGLATRRSLTSEERRRGARKAALARWRRIPASQRREAARNAVRARWARDEAQRVTRKRILVIGERVGWPQAAMRDGRRIPAGESGWRQFLVGADASTLELVLEALSL